MDAIAEERRSRREREDARFDDARAGAGARACERRQGTTRSLSGKGCTDQSERTTRDRESDGPPRRAESSPARPRPSTPVQGAARQISRTAPAKRECSRRSRPARRATRDPMACAKCCGKSAKATSRATNLDRCFEPLVDAEVAEEPTQVTTRLLRRASSRHPGVHRVRRHRLIGRRITLVGQSRTRDTTADTQCSAE